MIIKVTFIPVSAIGLSTLLGREGVDWVYYDPPPEYWEMYAKMTEN